MAAMLCIAAAPANGKRPTFSGVAPESAAAAAAAALPSSAPSPLFASGNIADIEQTSSMWQSNIATSFSTSSRYCFQRPRSMLSCSSTVDNASVSNEASVSATRWPSSAVATSASLCSSASCSCLIALSFCASSCSTISSSWMLFVASMSSSSRLVCSFCRLSTWSYIWSRVSFRARFACSSSTSRALGPAELKLTSSSACTLLSSMRCSSTCDSFSSRISASLVSCCWRNLSSSDLCWRTCDACRRDCASCASCSDACAWRSRWSSDYCAAYLASGAGAAVIGRTHANAAWVSVAGGALPLPASERSARTHAIRTWRRRCRRRGGGPVAGRRECTLHGARCLDLYHCGVHRLGRAAARRSGARLAVRGDGLRRHRRRSASRRCCGRRVATLRRRGLEQREQALLVVDLLLDKVLVGARERADVAQLHGGARAHTHTSSQQSSPASCGSERRRRRQGETQTERETRGQQAATAT